MYRTLIKQLFREKFKPRLAFRSSMADYKEEEGLVNLPLYAIDTIRQLSNKLV